MRASRLQHITRDARGKGPSPPLSARSALARLVVGGSGAAAGRGAGQLQAGLGPGPGGGDGLGVLGQEAELAVRARTGDQVGATVKDAAGGAHTVHLEVNWPRASSSATLPWGWAPFGCSGSAIRPWCRPARRRPP